MRDFLSFWQISGTTFDAVPSSIGYLRRFYFVLFFLYCMVPRDCIAFVPIFLVRVRWRLQIHLFLSPWEEIYPFFLLLIASAWFAIELLSGMIYLCRSFRCVYERIEFWPFERKYFPYFNRWCLEFLLGNLLWEDDARIGLRPCFRLIESIGQFCTDLFRFPCFKDCGSPYSGKDGMTRSNFFSIFRSWEKFCTERNVLSSLSGGR